MELDLGLQDIAEYGLCSISLIFHLVFAIESKKNSAKKDLIGRQFISRNSQRAGGLGSSERFSQHQRYCNKSRDTKKSTMNKNLRN